MRLGELCAGYGGLGMAVEEVFNAESAWFSEFDAAPSKILAHHWPQVPNYGDMTKIDWANIEAVDIISGGTPCQDLSAAGRRKGMTEGTRSNLWVQMREAIAIQRPRYVVWENVRGAFSAEASSDLEQCPGCVGDTSDGRVFLRALGRVLGDLSDLGYDCQWRGLRASDVGAPHARFRVFVLAQDANLAARGERRQSAPGQAEGRRTWANLGGRGGASSADADNAGRGEQRRAIPVQPEHAAAEYAGADASDPEGIGWGEGRAESARFERGLSTPGDSASTANTASARRAEGQDSGTGVCHACQRPWSVESERVSGERTVTASNSLSGGRDGRAREARREALGGTITEWTGEGNSTTPDTVRGGSGRWAAQSEQAGSDYAALGSDQGATNWGDYEPAIRRWERTIGRAAPRPTEPTGRNNGQRLSPRFTEWMMGLPDGWVTDPAIGISRNEQLKACGNGVVPQQATAALRDMLAAFETPEA